MPNTVSDKEMIMRDSDLHTIDVRSVGIVQAAADEKNGANRR
jgi:hypothetical protein